MTETSPRLLARLSGAALMLLLAACSNGADTADPATAEVSTAPAAEGGTIRLSECAAPNEGKVHFQIGTSVLAVPGNIVLDTVPAGLAPPITKERVVAHLKNETTAGGGCPGKPLKTGLLLIRDDLGHPLLDGSLGLLALPPGGIIEQFAAQTRRLQEKPAKTCRPIGKDLLGCVGTEQRGNVETPVMYLISTDKRATMISGGPLAARCVIKNENVEGCNLVDQLDGGLAIDAGLKSGTYSTAELRKALEAAVASVRKMRI